jgi:hypothetical protein
LLRALRAYTISARTSDTHDSLQNTTGMIISNFTFPNSYFPPAKLDAVRGTS